MSDESAFLAQILASPADDTVRLVYADWLDEHGRPERAEFIRVQVKLAEYERMERDHEERRKTHPHMLRYGGNCDCARLLAADRPCPYCRAVERERELFRSPAIREFLPKSVGANLTLREPDAVGSVCGARLRRGFVDAVACPAAVWLDAGDAIRALQPIERVVLTTAPAWERYPKADGYGRLVGREKIECLGCVVGARDHSELVRRLLKAEWPGVEFELPDFGPGPLGGAYPAWRTLQHARAAFGLAAPPLRSVPSGQPPASS